MSREDEVDHKMLKGFYFAYKDGTPYPSTIRDSSLQGIDITVDEFRASRRRLMQNGLLDGTKRRTRGGAIWSPNEISNKGILIYEKDNVEPLFRGMVKLDLGYSSKKFRFLKWVKNHNKLTIITILLAVLAIPSSIAGINEFTSFLPEESEPYVCHTGIMEGWYKNCEHGFQFEIPTENWLIYDKNTGRFNGDPFDDLDVSEYWIVIEHKVDYLGLEAASILFQIHDLTEHPWGTTLDEVLEHDKNKTSNDPYFYNVTYNRVNDEYWYVDFIGNITDEYDFHCSSDVRLIDTKMHTRQFCIAEWIFEKDDWPLLFNDLDQFDDSFRYVEN